MPSWFASAFINLSSQIKGVQEEATAARAEVAKLKAAQSLTSQITQAPKPKLKSPGLQAQFATNETVLQKVDAAISVLPDSAPEAKELLTQGKHEICKRQKHLKIADSFDWETVRVYLEKRSCQLFYYCVHMAEKTTSLCYVSFYVRCSVFHLGYVSLYVRCSVLDLPTRGSRVLCTCTADIVFSACSPRIRVRMCMREELYFLLWSCFLHELFRIFRLLAWLISFRRC